MCVCVIYQKWSYSNCFYNEILWPSGSSSHEHSDMVSLQINLGKSSWSPDLEHLLGPNPGHGILQFDHDLVGMPLMKLYQFTRNKRINGAHEPHETQIFQPSVARTCAGNGNGAECWHRVGIVTAIWQKDTKGGGNCPPMMNHGEPPVIRIKHSSIMIGNDWQKHLEDHH